MYPRWDHLLGFVQFCCGRRGRPLCSFCRECFARAVWRKAYPPWSRSSFQFEPLDPGPLLASMTIQSFPKFWPVPK